MAALSLRAQAAGVLRCLRPGPAASHGSEDSLSHCIAGPSRLGGSNGGSSAAVQRRAFSSTGLCGDSSGSGNSRSRNNVLTPPSPTRPTETISLPARKRFQPGQYYSPQSLNLQKLHARTPRPKPPLLGPPAAEARRQDLLHRLHLRPGHPTLHDDSYKNPVLLSTYVSEMGKIQPRSVTGLTRRSQREIGKAVRRARSMGLMPVMSRNPNSWIK